MKKIISLLLFCLIFIECLDNNLAINIESFPLSLSSLVFTIIGVSSFLFRPPKLNRIHVSFIIIYLLILISSITAGTEAITRSIALLLFTFASIGWSGLWGNKYFNNFLTYFFVASYLYWAIYLINIVDAFGDLKSYSNIFTEGKSVVNHHTIARGISVSSIYLVLFLHVYNFKKLLWPFITITFLLIVLSESRSNMIVYLILILFYIYWNNRVSLRTLAYSAIMIIVLSYSFDYVFSQVDFINERFSFNYEYQAETNRSRLEIIENIPKEISSNLMGKGSIKGSKVNIGTFHQLNPHNQYITFLLSGGIFVIIPLFIFIKLILNYLKNGSSFFSIKKNNIGPLFGVIITYWITLLTIDLSGLFYFIVLSITMSIFDRNNVIYN